MVVYETVYIGEEVFVKAYSNENKYIEREGVHYVTALDPFEEKREYTETDIDIATAVEV